MLLHLIHDGESVAKDYLQTKIVVTSQLLQANGVRSVGEEGC